MIKRERWRFAIIEGRLAAIGAGQPRVLRRDLFRTGR